MLLHSKKYAYFLLIFLFCSLTLAAETGKRTFTLVIDAGHGGHDAGAVGARAKEKDINLRVALAFGRLVENNCSDVKVIYTRKTDVFVPLQRRADIANNAKADLFISVHTNALPNGKIAYGSETYSLGMARADENLAVAKRENAVITLESDYRETYNGFDPNKAESYVIFEVMQDSYMKQSVDLATCIQREYKRSGRPDKGVHQAGFLVLRNTSMPSVLTELGFISTPAEEQYLTSERGVEELSRSIYAGFAAYLQKHGYAAQAALPAPTTNDDSNVAVAPVQAVRTRDLATSSQQEPPAPAAEPSPKEKPAAAAPAKASTKEKSAAATPAAKPKEKTTANKQQTKPAAKKTTAASKKPRVAYRIQLGAGKKQVATNDPQFKGFKVERVKEGSFFKYFYGNYATYTEAQKALRTVKAKLPEAYLVAYVDGKAASVKEAREKEKSTAK